MFNYFKKENNFYYLLISDFFFKNSYLNLIKNLLNKSLISFINPKHK